MSDQSIPRKRRLGFRTLEKWKDFSLALPALLFLAIFTYFPLVSSFYISMTNWDLIKPIKKYLGFKNYERLLGDEQFYHVLKVTFTYTILDVVLSLLIGLGLALLFNHRSRAFGVMRLLIFMPYYISMVIASMVFVWILNPEYGVLNKALHVFGIEPVYWLNDPSTALWSVVSVSVWKGVGFAMIIFIAGLRSIPTEYYEASSIDGADKWRQLLHITIPLLSPTTLFLVITSFISSMQVFQSVSVMTGGGPLGTTKVMVMWIYEMAFVQFKAGKASALVIIFFFIIIFFTFIQFSLSKRKVHYEG
ncbi:ABC transporter permease [Paenibacillus selenitireducens]|uniref:ABC transporter permease n=1 Tax=Paenibacillus selenitireducens TaxID=1324314 RepID=A0A1T2XKP3_9BACL|nr:sugar ABC transporter permease [Paenibacillus selenitireducens]OPA80440.1 ABC transporter permease [Paenibacillus selenitireducens]